MAHFSKLISASTSEKLSIKPIMNWVVNRVNSVHRKKFEVQRGSMAYEFRSPLGYTSSRESLKDIYGNPRVSNQLVEELPEVFRIVPVTILIVDTRGR